MPNKDVLNMTGARVPFLGKLRIRHFEIVLAIAEFGSLAKAAGQLHLTQSGLSRMIMDIEEVVRGRLFERTGKGMVCTPLGHALCRHARVLLGDLDKAETELAAIAKGNRGSLVIGCFAHFAGWPLADAVQAFRDQHPLVSLTIHTGMNERLIEDLDSGKIDLIVGRCLPTLNPEIYRYTDLMEDSIVLVCGIGHPLLKKKEVSLSDCVKFPWIVAPEKNRIRLQLEDKLHALGLALPNFVGALSLEFSLSMLSSKQYVCMLPGSVARQIERHGEVRVLPIPLGFVMPPIAVVWRRERSSTLQLREFVDVMASVISAVRK